MVRLAVILDDRRAEAFGVLLLVDAVAGADPGTGSVNPSRAFRSTVVPSKNRGAFRISLRIHRIGGKPSCQRCRFERQRLSPMPSRYALLGRRCSDGKRSLG